MRLQRALRFASITIMSEISSANSGGKRSVGGLFGPVVVETPERRGVVHAAAKNG